VQYCHVAVAATAVFIIINLINVVVMAVEVAKEKGRGCGRERGGRGG
jgi:hypothetical protein